MRILLGHSDGNITIIDTPDSNSVRTILTDVDDLWSHHGGLDTEGETAMPAWVASDSDAVASALADTYGNLEIKSIDDGVSAYEDRSGVVDQ